MADAEAALEQAIVDYGGVLGIAPVAETTTWRQLRDRYGSSEAVAEAVGYPLGQRQSHPQSGWPTRKNFYRNFQGRLTGGRLRIDRVISKRVRDRLNSRTQLAPKETIDRIRRNGVVVSYEGTVIISKDVKHVSIDGWPLGARLLEQTRFFPPAYQGEWPAATDAFFDALGQAWGVGRGMRPDPDSDDHELRLSPPGARQTIRTLTERRQTGSRRFRPRGIFAKRPGT